MQHTADADEHFIQVPRVPRQRSSSGKVGTELPAPVSDAFMHGHDTAFSQDQLDVAQTEAEDVIQPHGVTDDLSREAMPGI
jgi:hypothetical protein